MRDSGEIFKETTIEAIKGIFSSSKDPKDNDKGLLALLGVFLFVGSEGVSVLFRKNFGRKGLNIGMIIGCAICMAGIAAFSFYYFGNPTEIREGSGSPNSFIATGILFSFLAIYILLKGIFHISNALKAGDYSNYKGDSDLLKFLKKDRWSEQQIRLIAEPALVLCFGISYCFYNLIGGVALVFCALSVWGREIVEVIILENHVSKKVNEPSISASERKSNNRVN